MLSPVHSPLSSPHRPSGPPRARAERHVLHIHTKILNGKARVRGHAGGGVHY